MIDMIAAAGVVFVALLIGALLAGAAVYAVLCAVDWRETRCTRRYSISLRSRAKHVKGEPTVRLNLPQIGAKP